MDIRVAMEKRNGFDKRFMRVLYRVFFPFAHCSCRVPEALREEDPMVFVCNHYEIFGPLAVMTSLPLRFRLWSNDEMLHPMDYVEKTSKGLNRAFPLLSEKTCRWIHIKTASLVAKAFESLNPVPVFRDEPSTIMTTLRQSVNRLLEGDNMLIFPEEGFPKYSNGGVTPFFPGFTMMGELYRRKTGKDLKFCPIYVDKKHRRIEFGNVVTYHSGNPTIETVRVADALHDQILDMAEKAGFDPEEELSRNTRLYSVGRQ